MTGNKGEWSELYTLFKLLADGKLYAADADTNKIDDIYYDILKAIRLQTDGKWEYTRKGSIKVVHADTNEEVCSVSIDKFKEQADIILSGMRSGENRSRAFDIPAASEFAAEIKCNTLKARSTDKTDITLMVHDIMCGRDDTFGFSIKSQIGGASTLFNASKGTNFIFNITGHKLNEDEINTFNEFKFFKNKFDYLQSIGSDVCFKGMANDTFEFNLMMVMTQMPAILAYMLKCFYSGQASMIEALTDLVAQENIINVKEPKILLTHKTKELLTNIALGMVPNTLWTGDYEATGGYIIVKDDGDILCYHIYNHNAFKNYLFKNTKLDTPSQTKHDFGSIENIGDEQILKLNLQIRFVK